MGKQNGQNHSALAKLLPNGSAWEIIKGYFRLLHHVYSEWLAVKRSSTGNWYRLISNCFSSFTRAKSTLWLVLRQQYILCLHLLFKDLGHVLHSNVLAPLGLLLQRVTGKAKGPPLCPWHCWLGHNDTALANLAGYTVKTWNSSCRAGVDGDDWNICLELL